MKRRLCTHGYAQVKFCELKSPRMSQSPVSRSQTGEITPPRDARVAASVVYFVLATLALVHPLFTWFGDSIEPRFMGLPFSLVYVLGVVTLNSVVLTWMYRSRLIGAQDDE